MITHGAVPRFNFLFGDDRLCSPILTFSNSFEALRTIFYMHLQWEPLEEFQNFLSRIIRVRSLFFSKWVHVSLQFLSIHLENYFFVFATIQALKFL